MRRVLDAIPRENRRPSRADARKGDRVSSTRPYLRVRALFRVLAGAMACALLALILGVLMSGGVTQAGEPTLAGVLPAQAEVGVVPIVQVPGTEAGRGRDKGPGLPAWVQELLEGGGHALSGDALSIGKSVETGSGD